MSKEPRVLLLDLETSPIIGYSWGVYEQNLLKVIEPSKIIMAAWQWLGETKIHCKGIADYKDYRKGKVDDKKLVEDLWKLVDEADIICGHNADQFDIKVLNARFITHGLSMPSGYKTIDTKKVAKKYFRFGSNKLDWLGDYLGEGRKEQTGGFDLWLRCIAGDPKAWATMRRYNIGDIRLLNKIYLRLRPYMSNHPNLNIIAMKKGYNCPACQSSNVQSRGTRITNTGNYRSFQCRSCGSWSHSKFTAAKGVELR